MSAQSWVTWIRVSQHSEMFTVKGLTIKTERDKVRTHAVVLQ